MNEIKAKLSHAGRKSKTSITQKDPTKDLGAYREFFSHYESKMMNMLQPSSQGRAKAALKHIGNKPSEYHYEEGKFNRFLSKRAEGASNTFGEALQSMSTTYKQIEDLKKERESELKNRIFNQNLKDITRELESLAKLEKSVQAQQSKVESAEKQVTKVGDAVSLEKAEVAKRNLRQEESRLKQSTDAFMQVEPQRIAMLQNAAEIECEYYRKAAEAFQELQTTLTQIKERALSNPEVSHGTEDYIHTPRQEFAYSTVIESSMLPTAQVPASCNQGACCRALHTFEAELEEDLAFQEGDIIKIIQKVDDDWYFGELNGRRGHFPANFVEVIVPLS